MIEEEMKRAAEKLVAEYTFPPEERKVEPITRTTEEDDAYQSRLRKGYYLPGLGAFDTYEGPRSHEHFTVDSPHPIPFHIGQGAPAVQQSCGKCGSIVFHLGIADYYTALRCANCGREWCQHNG